jgi:hypothetical protein
MSNNTEAAPSLEIFKVDCEVRAALFAAGELELHEAVDSLQYAAAASGLVALVGQDVVQSIMAEAFKPHCGVARSVIDAVGYLIRQDDPTRLRAFLARQTAEERAAIKQYFERQK